MVEKKTTALRRARLAQKKRVRSGQTGGKKQVGTSAMAPEIAKIASERCSLAGGYPGGGSARRKSRLAASFLTKLHFPARKKA
jgi:hypothetical protein